MAKRRRFTDQFKAKVALEALLYIASSGCQWRMLPKGGVRRNQVEQGRAVS